MSSTTILQSVLVDLLDLGWLGKQAHWNVYGPRFKSVHVELDTMVEELIVWQDEVAERIAALGGNPDGRAATVAASSAVAPLDGGFLRDEDVLTAFAARLAACSKTLSGHLSGLDDDLASQDILIGIIAGLDKQAWFFRAQTA
ncbi:MAG: DNA starvation/stationary phase protection protein [Actinomycetia bacterium]|nr:DNA starvation/stationary phase protection protein [Actinomycetes bacterium]